MVDRYEPVYSSPNGPGDARPSAYQIIKDEGLEGKWNDRCVLITGASAGIGIHTAKALFETGASLFLTARDLNKARKALGSIVDSDRVHLLELDLSSLASVRKAANEFLSQSSKLNVLIANAGIMACPEGRTVDGFETHFGTNHLAHFLLVHLLTPTLLQSATPAFNSRVVILSSSSHHSSEVNFDNITLDGEYNPWTAYEQSKTANLWTANKLDRLYGSRGLHAWAVHPGNINTGLLQYMTEDQVSRLLVQEGRKERWKNEEQGASTTIWAATAAALEGQGGKYLEDTQIAKPWQPPFHDWAPGYNAQWAYDPSKEDKLWQLSLELLGLSDDHQAKE